MTQQQPAGLYIIGFGGHARSVADIAMAAGIGQLIFIDPKAAGQRFAGFPAIAALPDAPTPQWQTIVAVGNNGRRRMLTDETSLEHAILRAPTATIGIDARIGSGSVISHHAHVGAAARIGRGVIVNTAALVEHDSRIGDFSHVAINACVAGGCSVGSGVLIGAGACVIENITICDDVTIGAGATVVSDIEAAGTYVGTPARRIAP